MLLCSLRSLASMSLTPEVLPAVVQQLVDQLAEQRAEVQSQLAEQRAEQQSQLAEQRAELQSQLAEHQSQLAEQRGQRLEDQAKIRYLARDKGLVLAKAVVDHVESAHTGRQAPASTKIQLEALFEKNPDFRARVMSAVQSCPGWEAMSSTDFVQLGLAATLARNGAHTAVPRCKAL